MYEAAGVTVPATGYVRLTVNGQAYSLYLNVETPDTAFLKRRFGDGSGILYEGAYGADLRAGDLQRFSLRPAAQGLRLVAADSGKCVAVAPGYRQGAALIQVTCTQARAQTWRVQRSIYQ